MRFKMRFESEDAAERRYTGWITGVGDMDPVRWSGSKWRCLLVRWDDNADNSRQNRVSPWEIEPIGSVSGSTGMSASSSKRSKICLPSASPKFPTPNGNGCLDLGESSRFHKVLQGQEIFGFRAPYRVAEMQNHLPPEARRSAATDMNYGILSGHGGGARVQVGNSELFPYKCTGFGESVRFHEVLQGQEIFPFNPPMRAGGPTDPRAENCGFGLFEGLPPGSGPPPIQGYTVFVPPPASSTQASSPSSVLMCPQSVYEAPNFSKFSCGNDASLPLRTRNLGFEIDKEPGVPRVAEPNGCKLFGFSLTDKIQVAEVDDDTSTESPPSKPHTPTSSVGRSCTQVHKQGSCVGRLVDLSKFDGYDGLICELERLFDMEGLLNDKHNNKWHVVYSDEENEMMLVGDDPWQEFCGVASRILIYTDDDVEVMAGDA